MGATPVNGVFGCREPHGTTRLAGLEQARLPGVFVHVREIGKAGYQVGHRDLK